MRAYKIKNNTSFRIHFLFFCLFLNSTVFAYNDSIVEHKDKCRFEVTETEAPKSLSDKVSDDLCSRVWTEFKKGGKTVYEFNEYGTLNIINEQNEGGFEITYYTWELAEENGNAILLLTNPMNNESTSFEVAQDCDGIFLTGINGGSERFLSIAAIQ